MSSLKQFSNGNGNQFGGGAPGGQSGHFKTETSHGAKSTLKGALGPGVAKSSFGGAPKKTGGVKKMADPC